MIDGVVETAMYMDDLPCAKKYRETISGWRCWIGCGGSVPLGPQGDVSYC
jgi:hypothetical protein